MAICKVVQSYENKNGWSIGDVVDISDPIQLIKENKVVLVNDKGEEIAPSWVSLKCPICVYEGKDPTDLAHHILGIHAGKPVDSPKTADSIKQQRLDNLAKARAAHRLKKLQANVEKQEGVVADTLKEAVEATVL